ncbi:spore germination protein GerPC [Xylanibacillus composti]|uniref:Spore germination protein PC n=1 Tax=Xylanibacillus composti TaxID=1572762 RepID=A0A8J4M1T3_9BACL|nr:spore germination protein GerPC [Xylanibacillus composti]GIQ67821.1 hypothetical protein XYCOK13_06450 [Xylanibacillus composti]
MYEPNILQVMLHLVQQMHHTLCLQHEQLRRMEAELAAIKEQLANQQQAPGTHVEKIEYNFEQLKVDTLDGTLVIGISPNETGNIAQWALQQTSGEDAAVGSSEGQEETNANVRERMAAYIRDAVPPMLEQMSEQSGVPLTGENKRAILEDMLRQIDGRIAYYSKKMPYKEGASAASAANELAQALQNDIHAAIQAYVEHFREEREEDD